MRMTQVPGLLLALSTGACIIHDDDDRFAGAANIQARWDLRDVDGTRTGCPLGYATAQVTTQQVDELGTAIAPVVMDLFDCNAGFGITSPLAADRQLVWIDIVSDDGRLLYAQSTAAMVDLYQGGGTFDAIILNDGGYFQLDWNLVGEASNRSLSCSDAGVDAIEAISTTITTPTGALSDKFICEDHYAISGALVAGSYAIALDAEARGQTVGTAPTITREILDRNRITDLGSITIPIEGL